MTFAELFPNDTAPCPGKKAIQPMIDKNFIVITYSCFDENTKLPKQPVVNTFDTIDSANQYCEDFLSTDHSATLYVARIEHVLTTKVEIVKSAIKALIPKAS
jgi:hypothetical protein